MDFTNRVSVKWSHMVGHTSRALLGFAPPLVAVWLQVRAREGQRCFKRSLMQALTVIMRHTPLHLDSTGIHISYHLHIKLIQIIDLHYWALKYWLMLTTYVQPKWKILSSIIVHVMLSTSILLPSSLHIGTSVNIYMEYHLAHTW